MSALTDLTVAQIRDGQVDMRPVQRRQVFIGGKPYGDALPMTEEPAPDMPVGSVVSERSR